MPDLVAGASVQVGEAAAAPLFAQITFKSGEMRVMESGIVSRRVRKWVESFRYSPSLFFRESFARSRSAISS